MDLLFIDFDGVICDSVNEAYISSWAARYGLDYPEASIEGKQLFCSYRPFIKTGSDFMILQDCVARNVELKKQADFNREHGSLSNEEHRIFNEEFYKARTFLLENYPDFWYGQNRLYPGVRDVLSKLCKNPNVYILSTKKSAFILKLLARNGLDWNEERALYAARSSKIEMIEVLLDKHGCDKAVLLEDQSEYFRDHPNISFYLALWGYVADKDSACAKADKCLSLDDLECELKPWFAI